MQRLHLQKQNALTPEPCNPRESPRVQRARILSSSCPSAKLGLPACNSPLRHQGVARTGLLMGTGHLAVFSLSTTQAPEVRLTAKVEAVDEVFFQTVGMNASEVDSTTVKHPPRSTSISPGHKTPDQLPLEILVRIGGLLLLVKRATFLTVW